MPALTRSALLAALLAAAISLLQGCTTLADARKARGTGESRVYDAPADAIWSALPGVLKAVGLEHVGDNRAEGYVLAQRGITPFSYGENVAIFVEALPKSGRTRVEVVSKKSMETNIFAPNWSRDILDGLAQRLADAATPATGAPKTVVVDDVNAVPLLSDKGREGYRAWLTKSAPRAFVIAEGGRWFATWGNRPVDRSEPGDPAERAMARCRNRGHKSCRLYAVDDRVVWNWE